MEAVSITEAADRLPKNVRDSLPKGLATQDVEADFGIFRFPTILASANLTEVYL